MKSVAIIGAGAAGAATAAAFASEDYFDVIRVFERRETAGGTWIYDADPGETSYLRPGKLPADINPALEVPENLPQTRSPSEQNRWDRTPIYAELTTNVPEIAMSFSDHRFPYGPFVPHWIPKQYIQDYFTWHKADRYLVLNTTVEKVTKIPPGKSHNQERWKLTLRRYDATRHVDVWWEEDFEALILANGHFSVPYIPAVKGLEEFIGRFPGLVSHSKSYRVTSLFAGKRVLVVGNSASGHDIATQLILSGTTQLPVYQSRRSKSRWDGNDPPEGMEWKPVIREYKADTKEIVFEDDSVLRDVDAVIYCTGYKHSFPFWDSKANGGPLFDYHDNKLVAFYQHTISQRFPRSLGTVGPQRAITFRSFEYQAVALARLFSDRNSVPLPTLSEMRQWERERLDLVRREKRRFHEILWDNGETAEWLRWLYTFAGLPVLEGQGRYPPVLDKETRWAYEHIRKYPDPGQGDGNTHVDLEGEWVVVLVDGQQKDSMHFI